MATKKKKETVQRPTTQSVYGEILKNHGVQADAVASSKQTTSQSKTQSLYNSILESAQKREKEKAQKQTTRQRLYLDQYNKLVKTVNSGTYNASQVESEANRLSGLYKDFFSDDSGNDMLTGLEKIKKAARRSTSSSGILPEEAEAMREQRTQWQTQMDAIDTDDLNQQLDAVTRNRTPDDYKRDPEYQRIMGMFQEEEELKEKIAAADAQLNLYDRTDGFRNDRIEPLKNKDGFTTAKADYAAGADQREQKKAQQRAEDSDSLQQVQQELDKLTYNKSPSQYQNDPEYQALISRMEELEDSLNADDSDLLGDYLDWYNSLDDDTRERLLEGRFNSQAPINMEIVKSIPSTFSKHWERMTDDEINAYYYIANTEGAQAAHDFLEGLQVTLDKRHTEGREQAIAEQMEESPTWVNAIRGVATVGANIIAGPMAFASDAIRAVEGKEFNPYSNAHYLQNITGAVRSAAANDIQQTVAGDGKSAFWNGVGELAANAYQSALSTLDSAVGVYTTREAYIIIMGMGAASSRMREMYESGATDEEIYKGAIGSGILEALFEKVSLDTLAENFIKENPEKWVKKLLIQAGVEGSEEFFTEISNLVLDSVNRGINSDHNQRVRELMGNAENPMGREEAEQQAAKEDTMDVFFAFLGGVMSGGMSSVSGAVMDASRQNQSGQDILSRNVQEQIIAEGKELRQGDKLAQSLETKQKEGTLGKNEGIFSGIKDSRDATRLGRLLEQNVADMTSKDRSAVKSAVTARLTDEGGRIHDKEGTAEAIVKSLTGEGLGVYDRFLLASNEKVADKIRNEVYSAADGTTANNAWVKRIETYGHTNGTTLKETAVEKAGREAMETTVKEEFGQHAETVMKLYNINRGLQNRMDFVAEAKEVYQAGMDGVPLDQAPKTTTLTEFQREAVWDMGQGKSDYDYDNNQGFATIKGETTPVNIVAVESTDGGTLTLRTDDGQVVSAKDVTFGSYSQSKLYSVISAMGVDTETANEIVTMSNETGLDLNVFSRAMQDAFFAGRNGIPFADIPKDRYAMKLTEEQRKVAWKAGRAAARERAVQKGKRVQQGKHGRAKGGVKMEASARNIQHLNAQQQAGMNAANVLGALGLDITVYASTEEQRAKGMENGYIQLSDGSIHIDLNSGDSGEGVMAWALSHEFTHFVEEMSPEKFQSFQDVLFQELGQSNQDVMELIESKVAELSSQEQYSDLSEERLWEIATSEVVAEMMEPMLTDTDAIARISDNLRQQDKGLWEKIKDWLQGLVEKLKKAYKDLTPGSAIARQTREVVTQSEEILNAWVEAATDAVVNYNLQDGQKNNTPGGVQYSIRNTSRMGWEEQLKAFRNSKMLSSDSFFFGETPAAYGPEFEGNPLVMNQKDYRKSKSEKHNVPNRVLKKIPELLSKPIMTFTQGDRLAVVLNEIDGDGKPLVAALHANEQMDRQSVTAVTSIYGVDNWVQWLGHQAEKEIKVFDKERANRYLQTYGSNASVEDAIRSTGDSLSDTARNVNPEDTLYSSRNVQQTKNLVALHNITEDKFLKTLELGGFPMPSIAITKADIPHTNFGDITVVFGRETIDPKANRKNTVYSADAWTPTVPQVEYEADSKATSRVYKRLSGLRNQVDEYFQRDLGYATYNLEATMNRYGGEEGVVQAALDNYGVKAAYLEEQGQHITPETKRETVGTPVSEEMQDRYVKIMDILGVDDPEQINKLILKEVKAQHGAELEAVYPGITKSALRLGGLLNRIKAWLQGNNGVETRTVTDVRATQKALDSAIDKTEFEAWVRNLYQGVEKSSGVYNGKPYFTEAGNSRTFKQTHLPATLEGIVKAMAAQNNGNTKNVSWFNGVKTLRAGTAERFSSIADMHKMEGRLQNLTEAQQNEIHDSLSNRLYDTIKAIDEESGANLGGSNSLNRYDTIGEILMEIAESGSYNVADIQRVFQQYGKTISDETAMVAKELLFDVSQMPVNIFEAKPERAVGFEEIKTVLVPDTASQKLLQELDSRGIPYQTYQAGNEEQRHQMVQDMEDIRFSQRSAAQLERENKKLRQDKKYLKELVKIQRQGNKDVVPTRASVNSMAEALKKQNGVRGNTAELAALLDDFYRYIGKGNLDTVEMDRLVGKAADWIQEHQQAKRDPYAQEVLDWMKKRHVSLNQTQVDEIKYQYGSLREYQSAIKGSIIIDQKANTSLGQLWQEGASQFADQFGSDVTDGDMPRAFADMVERLRNSEDTDTAERRYRQEEFHRDLMDQVYDTYFSVKPVASISDTMRKSIKQYRQQRDAADKAMKQQYEKQHREVQKQYKMQMAELEASYSQDSRIMEREFKRLVKEYDKQGASLETIRERLEQSTKELAGSKENEEIWKQEFNRLLRAYDQSGRNIGKLEQTIERQRATAKAKVESRGKTELRGKIQRSVDTLNRMLLNPTKTQYVPDSLQPAVLQALEVMNNLRTPDAADVAWNPKYQAYQAELLGLLKDGGSRKNMKRINQIVRLMDEMEARSTARVAKDVRLQEALSSMKERYAKLADSNEGIVAQVYDEQVVEFIQDALDAVKDTPYSELNKDQLTAVKDAYAAILHRVRTANKAFLKGKSEEITQLAMNARKEISTKADKKKLTNAPLQKLSEFEWNNLKPVYAFERMGSATMTTLYNNLRNGEDTFYRDVSDGRAYALATMEKYGYEKWQDELITFTSTGGKQFALNLEERMSLYAYSRREQAIEHLMKGGIILSENTKRTVKNRLGVNTEMILNDKNIYTLSLDTIQQIADSLTAEQKAFAQEMQAYLSTVCAAKNNEISQKLYGVSIAKEKFYWPLLSSKLFSEKAKDSQENPGNRQKNASHMKSTIRHANNPIVLSGLMDTWANHVNNTAMYHAFTLPMEDFYRVYNFKQLGSETGDSESIQQLIALKYGEAATKYIDQFLKDLNKGARSDPRESIGRSLTSKFKKGAVSASLSVAVQQPSAVGRAFAVIDPKYFRITDMKYYGTSLAGEKAEKTQARWEEMKRSAPVVGIKEMGRFDVNMGRSTVEFITGAGEAGFMAKVDEISGYLPEKMDQATWMMIYNAAERQCKSQGYTGENLKVATGKLFTEAITKTQVYDSVFSRSGNMRSKSLWMNMATSFMAEPTTTANMFLSAVADIRNGDMQTGKRKIASIATATVLNAFLASLVYAARDDDEDSPYREKLLKSFTSELVDSFNPVGYVPVVKDIWSIFQGYDVDRSDMTLWSEAAKALKRVVSAHEAMAKVDEDDADYEKDLADAKKNVAEAWLNAAGALCNMFGLPVKNLTRDIKALVNTVVTVAEDRDADWTTSKRSMLEGALENLPEVISKDSKSDELYKALTSESQVWVNRMRDSYSSDKAYETAVRKTLREHDKRIRQAAKALNNNADSTEYKRLVNAILSEGHFTQEQVEKAIQAEVRAISGSLSGQSTQAIEKFIDLYEDNLLDAEQYTAFMEYKDAVGEDGKRIHHKDEIVTYIGSMKVNAKAKDALYNLMGYDEKDLEKMPWHTSGYSLWEARVEIPELANYSDSAVETFLEIRNSQITVKVFTNAYEYRNAKDSEGMQLHTREEIMAYIDRLSLSRENKDELYLAMGYKETTLNKTPWN